MSVDTLQKASLAALAWFVCSVVTWHDIYQIVWPRERRIAAIRAGQYPIDVAPPIPLITWIAGFALPTAVVALLVLLYRNGTRSSP